MTDMYRGILLCLVLITLASCASMGPDGMSTNMSKILTSLRIDQYTLDTSSLYGGDKEEFEFMKKQDRMEIYHVPSSPAADALRYTVYYSRSSKEYWVTSAGGVDGGVHLFGPTKFPPAN